jgi:uncharacterized lipoprotein YmbA
MNTRPIQFLFLLLGGLVIAGAGGCSLLPQAQSDPTKYYVLSTEQAGAAAQTGAPIVHLRDVELASYLRGLALVVRRGDNEIEFREFSRWGEPLELGIARVLRDELVARGAASAVRGAGGRRDFSGHDFTLNVRVLACEGATNGSVAFRAVWEVASLGENAGVKARGEFRPADLRWDGKSETSLAAKLSEAVSGLAGEIAAALARK